jgi:baculoviral IAP repeat-containing protein 6 (apollon)
MALENFRELVDAVKSNHKGLDGLILSDSSTSNSLSFILDGFVGNIVLTLENENGDNQNIIVELDNDESSVLVECVTALDEDLTENPTTSFADGIDRLGVHLASALLGYNGENDEENDDVGYDFDFDNSNLDGDPTVDHQFLERRELRRILEEKDKQLRDQETESSAKSLSGSKHGLNGKQTKTIFSDSASFGILFNDLCRFRDKEAEWGYECTPIDNNIYHWQVKMKQFRSDCPLYLDMTSLDDSYSYSYVEFEVEFAMDLYPCYPPIVTLVRPRFEGFMVGRITSLPTLQLSNWSQVFGLDKVFGDIRDVLERNGKIYLQSNLNDPCQFPRGAYSSLERALIRLGIVTEIKPRIMQLDLHDKMSGRGNVYTNAFMEFDARTSANDLQMEKSSNTTDGHSGVLNDPSSSSSVSTPAASGIQVPQMSEPKASSVKKKAVVWAKGTGYGSSFDNSNFSAKDYKAAQEEKNRLHKRVLENVFDCLEAACQELCNPQTDTHPTLIIEPCATSKLTRQDSQSSQSDPTQINFETIDEVVSIVEQSCLIPLLEEVLSNDSAVEIDRNIPIYSTAYRVIHLMVLHDDLFPLLLQLPHQKKSLLELLFSKEKQLKILVKGKALEGDTFDKLFRYVDQIFKYAKKRVNDKPDLLTPYVPKVQILDNVVGIKEDVTILESETLANVEEGISKEYLGIMKDLQYEDVDNLYQYMHIIPSVRDKKRDKRLRQEHLDLSQSLPLTLSSSVWLRYQESSLDAMQVIISGPDDTPYSNGLFLFDILFPQTYPKDPPKCLIHTTGGQTVRFNPNLYACGKVCLSLLNTWPGGEGEMWDQDISTLNQVLVSIQGLIMVPDPYFNEPGYERQTANDKTSMRYNMNVRRDNIRWAMIDQLRNPKPNFKAVIKNHFTLKKNLINQMMDNWLSDDTFRGGDVQQQNNLRAEVEILRSELDLLGTAGTEAKWEE